MTCSNQSPHAEELALHQQTRPNSIYTHHMYTTAIDIIRSHYISYSFGARAPLDRDRDTMGVGWELTRSDLCSALAQGQATEHGCQAAHSGR